MLKKKKFTNWKFGIKFKFTTFHIRVKIEKKKKRSHFSYLIIIENKYNIRLFGFYLMREESGIQNEFIIIF